jgi:chromosome segregation ATPase
VTEKRSPLFASLYAALRSTLRSERDESGHAVEPRPGGGAAGAPGAFASPPQGPAGADAAPAAGAAPAALDVGGLQRQLDLLADRFAEQERRLEGLGGSVEEPAARHAAVCAALESVRARVRQRRSRIARRTAEQWRSARHVETRVRRLESRLEGARLRATRLLEVELAIARAEAALVSLELQLDEELPRRTARERELARCATERALLKAGAAGAQTARGFAEERIGRLRATLKQIRSDAGRLRALAAPVRQAADAAQALPLAQALADWGRRVTAIADGLAGSRAPSGPLHAPDGQLDTRLPRAQLEQRARLLEALAELRVEETQALHAGKGESAGGSHAALARVTGMRLRLRLEDAERAWCLEALQAVDHEQAARLLGAGGGHRPAATAALGEAVLAWRRCDERLEAAAVQARAAHPELAALRASLALQLARADAEGRELGTLLRQRREVLRSRRRVVERARERLASSRARSRALEDKQRRARRALERAHGEVDPPLGAALAALAALERDVEATAAQVAGLHAAHEHCARAIAAMERALRDLADLHRAAAPPPAGGAAEERWSRARMELDIDALAGQLAHWKARHEELERRVAAQARALSVLEVTRGDEDLAALCQEVEQARRSAEASLARALAPQAGRSPEPS